MALDRASLHAAFCAVVVFAACTPYERQDGCHLDNMNVKGNVTKIETIVQSTIPLTELFYGSLDPSMAISMFAGNLSVDIDKHGNIDRVKAYGIDGELMLTEEQFNPYNDFEQTPCVIGVTANQEIDDVKTTTDADGKITGASYYSHGKLIWEQRMSYNDMGDIAMIVKDYVAMGIKVGDFTIEYKDSTKYDYQEYDSHDNWTRVSVDYRGILKKHHHVYTVLRQMTYDGESSHAKLLDKLASVNKPQRMQSNSFISIPIGHYGSMKIPSYMAESSDDFVAEVKKTTPNSQGFEYLYMSSYDKDDAYATISIAGTHTNGEGGFDELSPRELAYDKETDEYLKEMYTAQMAQGQVYILKWLPYEFTTISGRRVMRNRYYRYGKGSPIPVYCELFTVGMDDGYTMTILYSYQSNMDARFHDDFERAINSVSFN